MIILYQILSRCKTQRMEAKSVFQLNLSEDIKQLLYKSLWKEVYPIDTSLKKDICSFVLLENCLEAYDRKYMNSNTPLQYMDVMLYDMCIQVHHDSDDDITYMLAYYFEEEDQNVHITLVNDVEPENKYMKIRDKWRRMSPEDRYEFSSNLKLGKFNF